MTGKEETQEETRECSMNVFNQKSKSLIGKEETHKETRKKKKQQRTTVQSIGEQSMHDCGGRLGEGGCKDGISVL